MSIVVTRFFYCLNRNLYPDVSKHLLKDYFLLPTFKRTRFFIYYSLVDLQFYSTVKASQKILYTFNLGMEVINLAKVLSIMAILILISYGFTENRNIFMLYRYYINITIPNFNNHHIFVQRNSNKITDETPGRASWAVYDPSLQH